MDFATRLIPPAYDQVFAMADYYVWGATCIGDGSGRYHLFACRWPKSSQFWGWISHGEIVRAEGDRPEGPYQRVGREPLLTTTWRTLWSGTRTPNTGCSPRT